MNISKLIEVVLLRWSQQVLHATYLIHMAPPRVDSSNGCLLAFQCKCGKRKDVRIVPAPCTTYSVWYIPNRVRVRSRSCFSYQLRPCRHFGRDICSLSEFLYFRCIGVERSQLTFCRDAASGRTGLALRSQPRTDPGMKYIARSSCCEFIPDILPWQKGQVGIWEFFQRRWRLRNKWAERLDNPRRKILENPESQKEDWFCKKVRNKNAFATFGQWFSDFRWFLREPFNGKFLQNHTLPCWPLKVYWLPLVPSTLGGSTCQQGGFPWRKYFISGCVRRSRNMDLWVLDLRVRPAAATLAAESGNLGIWKSWNFAPLASRIGLEQPSFQMAWDRTNQKLQGLKLKLKASVLTCRDLDCHLCEQIMRVTCWSVWNVEVFQGLENNKDSLRPIFSVGFWKR